MKGAIAIANKIRILTGSILNTRSNRSLESTNRKETLESVGRSSPGSASSFLGSGYCEGVSWWVPCPVLVFGFHSIGPGNRALAFVPGIWVVVREVLAGRYGVSLLY